MVVEVFVNEHTPITSTHVTKEGVIRPGIFQMTRRESPNKRFEFCDI